MKVAIIKPQAKAVEIEDVADVYAALPRAKLKREAVTQSAVGAGLTIVVYEYSLFVSPDAQSYFQIDRLLYGGNAVLYAHHDSRFIDLAVLPTIKWFNNPAEIEIAIIKGRLQRPYIPRAGSVKPLWQWPRPRLEFMEKIKS